MRVRMILPALTEATSPHFRPIKYSLFPPLGLATLAGYLDPADEVTISDEHVERLRFDDDPEVVVIQVYITSARRAYEIADRYRARGAHVCLGGLHVTSLPEEAARHADTIFLGPGEDIWPQFLADYRAGRPLPQYVSKKRTLAGLPPIRRDLIKRQLYLVPNSIVVSRGCPHVCDFCYKVAFFKGGKQFYTQLVDDALAEIDRLPGRHLYFLDDHLFGNPNFAASLFDGMTGMGRLWQAAGTVKSVLERPELLEKAVASGLRSLFVGFETVNSANLGEQRKFQNIGRDYDAAVRRLHDLGVMVNGSFVFGMDDDGPDVFDRTVELGYQPGNRDGHVPYPHPVPGHRFVRADGGAGPHPAPGLGPLRHPHRRIPARRHGPADPGIGLLARLQRLLPMGIDLDRSLSQGHPPRQAPPPRLRRRLEEIRAHVGLRHQIQASPPRPPPARISPHRLRQPQTQARPAAHRHPTRAASTP